MLSANSRQNQKNYWNKTIVIDFRKSFNQTNPNQKNNFMIVENFLFISFEKKKKNCTNKNNRKP